MQTIDVVEQVRTILLPFSDKDEAATEFDYSVEVLIPAALGIMAERIWSDPASGDLRELLRKRFEVAVSGDTVDLTSLLVGDASLLLPSLRAATIFESGRSNALVWLPDRASLVLDRSPLFGYYAFEGQTLFLKNVIGNALTIDAGANVTLGALPEILEVNLVETVVELLGGKQNGNGASKGK